MARLRRLLHLAINLYETANQNRIKTGGLSELTVQVYPASVPVKLVVPIIVSGDTSVVCYGRGSLQVGDSVTIIREVGGVWTDLSALDHLTIASIEEVLANEGQFSFILTNSSGTETYSTASNDRIVAYKKAANEVPLFTDETHDANPITQPVSVPDDGILDTYVDVAGVDVYVSGDTIVNGWYAFNLATGPGEGALRLKAEILTATITTNVRTDTGIILLDTDTAAIQVIEHASPGRVLMIYPTIASLQITTFSTRGRNSIYEATPRTIDLEVDVPIFLVGVEASPGVDHWTILSTPHVIDLNLGDLGDTSTAGAVAGEPLVYDGANWGPADTIGSSAVPLATIYAADDALFIGDHAGGLYAQFVTTGLTGPRQFSLPDVSGLLMNTTSNADISGNKRFVAQAGSGFQLIDIGASRIVQFNLAGISPATTHILTIPDNAGTIALVGDLAGYVPVTDVAADSGSDGEILVHNGTLFAQSNKAGTASTPLDGVYVDGVSGNTNLRITNGSGFASRLIDRGGPNAMTADREHGLPNADGAILLDSTNLKQVTVTIPFVAATSGLFDMLTNDRNGHMCFALNTTTLLRASNMITKIDYQWCGYTAEGAVATPIELMLYADGALPTATTAPPAGANVCLVSNIPILSSAQYLSGTILGTGVNLWTDSFIYLAVQTGSGTPTISGHLVLNIEYLVDTGTQ